jgi:hypothetical protein
MDQNRNRSQSLDKNLRPKDLDNFSYKEALRLLTKPFPISAIQFRPDREINVSGKKLYKVVPYLDTRYIILRLNNVVPGDWNLETKIFPISQNEENVYGFYATSTLTILGVSHSDVGSSFILENDLDKLRRQQVKLDPKGAVTDSIRRVAALHGIGLYLWFLKKDLLVEDLRELKDKSRKVVEYEKYILEVGRLLYDKGLEMSFGEEI